MRGFDIAVAALALRASPAKAPACERQLAPAWGEPNAAWLDRTSISHQRAALIASLWPEPTRQCVAPPVFAQLPAPAVFCAVLSVSWRPLPVTDARALQAKLARVHPAAAAQTPEIAARAA
ncbi:MAG TPA: hypothetical protein VEA80_11040 [Vitreimonas sp.]|uniref:hypothetical protein n=1 Tax=Vitreimonas sp. TaxID=3069702 RepID=UPI002D399237|nr:hypothetical protein [Vitreimonas sp.]HYD88002.1 hypothetical protein [Vitreimonas sp.]